MRDRNDLLRRTGLVVFVLWALVFVLGATAEFLGLGDLAEATDLKRLFLR